MYVSFSIAPFLCILLQISLAPPNRTFVDYEAEVFYRPTSSVEVVFNYDIVES